YDVKIPYAEQIFNCMNTDSMPTTARRAFSRILHAIKTVTIVHQEQRQLCDHKKLVAEIGDYAIVYQLFKDTFLEDVGEFDRLTDEKLTTLEQQGPMTSGDLAQVMEVSKPTLTDWIKRNVESGYIYWVDEQEQRFSNDLLLKKAQKRGKAYLKVEQGPALPTPYELTLDPRWDVGGEFYKYYDLELEDTTARPEPAHAIDPFRSAA
ncbi:MarR family transcriptional regulator, partial [Desulfonatronospira sp. MSAO_Bac3]|uniref:MarR family transcriptional regulator n=1 Tax=Desulfonatronospira sp. MSAO_Bac3 TaxID=2293857 RepID=UPI000FEEA29B